MSSLKFCASPRLNDYENSGPHLSLRFSARIYNHLNTGHSLPFRLFGFDVSRHAVNDAFVSSAVAMKLRTHGILESVYPFAKLAAGASTKMGRRIKRQNTRPLQCLLMLLHFQTKYTASSERVIAWDSVFERTVVQPCKRNVPLPILMKEHIRVCLNHEEGRHKTRNCLTESCFFHK